MAELSLQLPDYDESEFGKRYSELSLYKVTIPPDLTALGYSGINELFSRLQAMLDRVTELLSEANHKEAASAAVFDAAKYAYEAKRAAKLGSIDKEQFESIKIAEAKVEVDLAEDARLMQRAKLTLGLFKAYRKSVQGAYKNLESAKKTLEIQTQNYRRQFPPPVVGMGQMPRP